MWLDDETSLPGKNHRHYITHAPLFILALSAIGFVLGFQPLAIMFLFGAWSHYILDSFGYGVQWLWPFKKDLYSFINTGDKINVSGDEFLQYWTNFVKAYLRRPEPYLEVLVIIIAIIVFI